MNNTLKIKQIKSKLNNLKVEFIDLKTLDLRGKLHSLILPVKMFNGDLLKGGVGFDSSSYGFAKPEESDMVMIPDLDTMFVDPFKERKTVAFLANIYLANKNRTRFFQDVRLVADKAEKTLKKSKIGTRALFSPEFEFFILKNVEYGVTDDYSYYFLEKDSEEDKNFYHCDSTEDKYVDFKNELVSIIQDVGIDIKYHHHEVSVNQHEIETKFDNLLKTADSAVIIKYIIFNLAKKYELFVTFMPKPFYGKAGSGWHVHQYLIKDKTNIFFERGRYGNFSRTGLSYLSGILFHSSSLCAFTNASTNSYKRFVEGFEAPVTVTYGKANRNGAIRIPSYAKEEETRIEYRSGDASSNPYLFLSSMLLAGIDGINKNFNPEKFNFGPFDNINHESKVFRKKPKKLPQSLTEALDFLEKDNEYLKYNDVFNDKLISQWIQMKRKEVKEIEKIPSPKEFELYFSF